MDDYPRLRKTATWLVLAHVMISATAVKHHKYSLASNVQSESPVRDPLPKLPELPLGTSGIKGMINDDCQDCVYLETTSAEEKEEKKKKRNCADKTMTKGLVNREKECGKGCKIWDCLYLNCDQFQFDLKKPIECKDCSMEPKVAHDCGCKKWICEKRSCDSDEYKVIEKCDSECESPRPMDDGCGCTKYSCEIDPAPRDSPCDNCKECEKCKSFPYRGKNCAYTGEKEEVCVPNCKAPKTCDSKCEVAKVVKTDDCGCATIECFSKNHEFEKACSSDGDCGPCEECVVADLTDDVCAKRQKLHMSKEFKKCQRKNCDKQEVTTCDVSRCEYAREYEDSCGCMKRDCTGNPPNKCTSHDECGECEECMPGVVCEYGDIKVDANECRKKEADVIKPCNACEERVPYENDCGVTVEKCQKKQCSPVVTAQCTGKCARPEEVADDCGCLTSVCRVQEKPKPKPPKKPVCKSCQKCYECQWVQSEECGIWEPACKRHCPTLDLPENVDICYEKITRDGCLCQVAPEKKPCKQLPAGFCPPGKVPCPTGTMDVCGCPHLVCCKQSKCKPDVTPKCKQCDKVVTYEDSKGCPHSYCEPERCQMPKPIACGECEEMVAEKANCGCYKHTCKKQCNPENECQPDLITKKHTDKCGCQRTLCCVTPTGPCLPPTTGSTVSPTGVTLPGATSTTTTTPKECLCGEICEEYEEECRGKCIPKPAI